ncbi:4-alpha-glucanotransferase DPE2 [Micractinium conductrix]|uniref:4-alpha-glucanotransferase n=1 Tax=Micractinium conductrix TaxID=554055 RepID=A0A2P6VI46_9CHLO|nr:4-alpha-glucanotransferase DPE2 [Micractinium conductrix]|eukprot:PSC73748.1 4-alpha-glucanotransferase DPE2 [Micractinium conductrix]
MGTLNSDRKLLLHFRTSYFTQWGEHVAVCGEGPVFGNWDVKKAHWLSCRHLGEELLWEGIVQIPAVDEFMYRLAVVNEAREVLKWANERHTVVLPEGLEDGAIVDVDEVWTDEGHPSLVLARSAFARVVWRRRSTARGGRVLRQQPLPNEVVARFQVHDGELKEGESVCILGGTAQLGNWQLQEVLAMVPISPDTWEAEVRLPLSSLPCTYKYGIRRADGSLHLEAGENRMVALPANDGARPPALVARFDGCFRRAQRWRGAGVAVPVFSLRSAQSVGAGEFMDLMPLVDLCAATGFSLIQVLPVNDTGVRGTWRDSYPYSSLCVFALHPLYLRLQALAEPLPADIAAEIEQARKQLDGKEVDYEATMEAKLRIAREVFDRQEAADMQSEEFQQFKAASWEWLQPYAVFIVLRRVFGTGEHWRWGALSQPTQDMLDRLSAPDHEWHASLQFCYWLQWQLHRQLAAASRYAASRNVALKGDLPIGVDKRSVDTWMYPTLFRMDVGTGAPPDYFDPNGQNWGFPTYNWEEMGKDGCRWWRRRLTHMAEYFHAYRIDHILGFFRIWEIPGDCSSGILGRFRPSIPLSRNELESKGIWDFDRLCEPYITDEVLRETLGAELAVEVAARFLQEQAGGRYRFRKQYASEAALQAAPLGRLFSDLRGEKEQEVVRRGLLSLRQNVVLLRDPEDPTAFYPRIALNTTSSFSTLEQHWRDELQHLHNDYFHHRQDALWRQQAHRTLPALMGATDMLVCGEDLGMIPACVHPVMQELGLIGLRIQRMPAEEGASFGDPLSYPYMTVASPASHDTNTTRGWWEGDAARRQEFYEEMLAGDGTAPEQCTSAVLEHILQQHMDSPSLLAIFPLQDLLPLSPCLPYLAPDEEQINDPTNPRHYWRYRLHVATEDVQADDELHCLIADMLQAAQRYHGADAPPTS